MNYQAEPPGLRTVAFVNDSGETIPAYGIIKITGTTIENDVILFNGDKPDTWGSQYSHYVNGPFDVADGKRGRCYVPTGPVWAKYDTGSTPAVGEWWGPKNGEWGLFQHVGGFQVVSADTGTGIVLVIQRPMLWFAGKTNAAHNQGTSGTVKIYAGATISSLSDTSVTKASVYNRFADLEADKWVHCVWVKNDEFEYSAGEC